MDHLVPVNSQCQTRASDIVKLIILDILSGPGKRSFIGNNGCMTSISRSGFGQGWSRLGSTTMPSRVIGIDGMRRISIKSFRLASCRSTRKKASLCWPWPFPAPGVRSSPRNAHERARGAGN
nr:hypothetical protein [Geobacillus sp. B4113_201601]